MSTNRRYAAAAALLGVMSLAACGTTRAGHAVPGQALDLLEGDDRVVGVLLDHAISRGDVEVVQRDQPFLQGHDGAAA